VQDFAHSQAFLTERQKLASSYAILCCHFVERLGFQARMFGQLSAWKAAVNAVRQGKSEIEGKAEAERRHWARLPLTLPVFLRGTDEAGKQFLEFSTALNISAGGMLVIAHRHLPPSASVSLEIPSLPMPPAVPLHCIRTFKAKAVHDLVSGRCHLVGLKFTRPMV